MLDIVFPIRQVAGLVDAACLEDAHMPASDMDEPQTLLKPRLRLLRRSPSPMHDASAEATPQQRPLRDDDDDEVPTPRMQPRPINAGADQTSTATHIHAETPAARLRALLSRELRSPREPSLPPAPPSEADSLAGPPRFGSSTSSVARESVRNIFSRALREPGDTPEKNRQRRNSFDGSSMEITPVVGRDKGKRRAPRRSLSDEEAEKPKSSTRLSRFSTAASFDALRARLMASQSQLVDQNLSETLNDTSDLHHHPKASTFAQLTAREAPSVSSSTTHPSFRMSSQLALHSNLLEQDSEMQRAMGDVLNSETEVSTSASDVPQPAAVPSDPRPSSSLGRSRSNSALERKHVSREPHSSISPPGSRTEEHNHQREREWNHPRGPSRSSTPEVAQRHSHEFHRRVSQEIRSPPHIKSLSHESPVTQSSVARVGHKHLERRSSIVSLRSLDDDQSSRPSSISSQADYRERISELERERKHEREREWNKRHLPSRPSSSLSTSSNRSFSHSHSHPPRSPSTTPYSAPTHASLQRKSSHSSLRSDSPASLASSQESLKEREQEETKEIHHERERNWNSPRPHWSISKSPSGPNARPRVTSLRATSSLALPEDSDEHRATPLNTDPSAASPTSLQKPRDRPDSGMHENGVGAVQSTRSNGLSPGKSPGAASRFGWNFSRSPLPPLELDDRHRGSPSPSPGSRPSNGASEIVRSSQIPVRSRMKSFTTAGYATSDMSLTNVVGDESSYQNAVSVPPSQGGSSVLGNSRRQEDTVLASDEESMDDVPQSTTPKSNPPKPLPEDIGTDTETEVLTSPSPPGSPRFTPSSAPDITFTQKTGDAARAQMQTHPPEETPVHATPPGTPPRAGSRLSPEMSPSSFALVTPPRQISFGSSVLDFRTPSPPHDLPDLPGPPSSSDDDALGNTPVKDRRVDINSNFTLTKTPKPPGGWAATPMPRKSMPYFSLESTPPASTSTPLSRASSLPPADIEIGTEHPAEDGLITPVGSLSRAKSLPLRTPAPPGAWLATPGQSALLGGGGEQSQYGSISKRKSLLKVRFDVTESEASTTEDHPSSPVSAVRLTNPELPKPKLNNDHGADDTDADETEGARAMPVSIIPPRRSTTPEQPTTPVSRENPSPRSLRKSPAVRVVDAFGRERVDEQRTATSLSNLPNGHVDTERILTPSTPRRNLVRIVDAMGREVVDVAKISNASENKENTTLEADDSIVSVPEGRDDAIDRLGTKLAVALTNSKDDRPGNQISNHLEHPNGPQALRPAQNQITPSLHVETAEENDLRDKILSGTRGLLPVTKKSWNATFIYGIVIVQLLLILAMWRYANMEARRLFYMTYYDPLYPELTPIQGSLCLSGTLSTSRSWTLIDSYETIRREGWWSIGQEVLRAVRHVGEQVWDRWGEHAHLEKPT